MKTYHLFFLLSCFLTFTSYSQSELDSLQATLSKNLNDSTRISTLTRLAYLAANEDPEKGSEYAFQAVELAKESDYKLLHAKALFEFGEALLYGNFYDSAITVFNEVNDLAAGLNNTELVIKTLVEKGYIFIVTGAMDEALNASFGALEMLDSTDYPETKAQVLMDIAEIYRRQEDGDNALKYNELAFETGKSADLEDVMYKAEMYMSTAYRKKGNNEKALSLVQGLMSKYSSVIQRDDSAHIYGNTANILMDLKRWDEAEESLLKAWEIRKDSKIQSSKAYALKNLGYLYNNTGRPEKAVFYNEQAYKIAKEIDHPYLLRDITGTLATAYSKLGNYERAFAMLKEQRAYRDQLMNQQRVQASEEMEKKYEAEKREQQIALQDEQLATQEARLSQAATFRNALIGGSMLLIAVIGLVVRNTRLKSKSLKEKEYLLKEIHHRVKNNLQVISSLLNMQSREAEDPGMLDVIKEGQSRVKAMSLIHQKLYQTDNLSEIDFEEYSIQLIDQLAALYKRDGLELEKMIEAKDIRLDIDTAIPLGLILNELISNSFKYAFNEMEKAELQISLERTSKEDLKLIVSDNGSGLPNNLDLATVKSLGLKLVNILTKQLKGSMSFSNENGARFEIQFKDLRMSA